MSATREALMLPLLFLTVVLAAGLRLGAAIVIQPPSLAALVAAVAFFALLVRSGTLAPDRLLNGHRSGLENANGAAVVATLFAATAQVISLLMLDSGVPALLAWAVLTSLLLQAFAFEPDRLRLLRGLMVTLGAAFVIKFVVLDALSAPAESRLGTVLRALFEGITLGAVTQPVRHPLDGYVAFVVIAMYLTGLALLPSANWTMVRVTRRPPSDTSLAKQ